MTSHDPGLTLAQRRIHAYHDGEMGAISRWLFERRLTRSPRLRKELESLASLAAWARELDDETATPDLWDDIALRLPAEDARRSAAGNAGVSTLGAAGWLRPIGAAAAAAAVALALAMGVLTRDTAPVGVVRWMDSGPRSVMMLEMDADTTIIWILDDGGPGDVSQGGMRDVV